MTDPKRWSEEGEENDVMRELVLAGQSRRMPDSERRAVWAGIALALPATPPPVDLAASASGATTAGSLGGYLTKGLLVLATLGGAGLGAVQLWPRAEPHAPAPVVARTPAAAVASPVPLATAPEPAVTALPVTSAVAAPSSATKARSNSESQLREESLAVLEARSALRAGNAARSLTLLEQARARFPRGALGQEREALTIEALARSGQSAAARRRAEAFLRQHPNSPYVADVRRVSER